MYRQRFLGSRKKTEQHFAAELCHGDPFEVRPPDICRGPAEVLQGAGPTVGPLAHGAMFPWCSMPKTKEKKGADPQQGQKKKLKSSFRHRKTSQVYHKEKNLQEKMGASPNAA